MEIYHFDDDNVFYVLEVYSKLEMYNSLLEGGAASERIQQMRSERYQDLLEFTYSKPLLERIADIEKMNFMTPEEMEIWRECTTLFEFRKEPVYMEGKFHQLWQLCMKDSEKIEFIKEQAQENKEKNPFMEDVFMEVYQIGQVLSPKPEKRISKK